MNFPLMAETGAAPARWRWPQFLIAALWPLQLLNLAAPLEPLAWALIAGLALYAVISFLRGRWQMRLLSIALGTVTVGICAWFDSWRMIPAGIEKTLIFVAFLCTIVLLRATADQRSEIAAARAMFTALDRNQRGGGVLIGSHVLGSVLIVGVFAVLAPILGRDAPEDERRTVALSAIRGMSLAVLWSPFFVGMAVASHYLPSVRLWQIMPLGLGFAALGLLIAYFMFNRAGGPGSLWRSLASLGPILPPVAVAALVVAVLTAVTPLTTLYALVFGMPVLCIAVLLATGPGKLGAGARGLASGIGHLGPEICLLTLAVTLGVVLEDALGRTAILAWLIGLQLAPLAIIAVMIGGMVLAGLAAIHPIVTGSIFLVLFTSFQTGVADLVLMQAMLFGWALGTMNSLASVSIATGSAMFGIAPERLVVRGNLILIVVFGAVSVFILGAINRLLVG